MEYLTNKELLEELSTRFEHLVVMGFKNGDGQPMFNIYKGSDLLLLGMMAHGTEIINHHLLGTIHEKEQDDA